MTSVGGSLAGLLVLLAAVPAVRPAQADRPMELRQLDERAWEAETRDKLAAHFKVAAAELRFSPSKRFVAWVLGPRSAPLHGPKRHLRRSPIAPRFQIVVADVQGRIRARLKVRVIKADTAAPTDLRFLDDQRLVYETVLPSRESTPVSRGKPRGTQPRANAPGQKLLVIQPVSRGKRPIPCEGSGFTFSPRKDQVAFVSGEPDAAVVKVDGRRVYPRHATSTIVAEPVWSPDGAALAFVEAPPGVAPRLILVADLEDGSSDTTWDLPPTIRLEGLHVFWAGPGKLVVGKTAASPAFATSFEVQRPSN